MPVHPSAEQIEHLRALLDQGAYWVQRARWSRWLDEGDEGDLTPIDGMDRDTRIAALAWLHQQRHVLHQMLAGGGTTAPEGWMESLPLAKALQA